jgi:hypothetical protein
MIFYDRPVALNRERHRALKLDKQPEDFSFASQTNSVLLAMTESAEAAKDYPIVFVGKAGGPFALAALVGLRENENLFVGADGAWATATYVPAFARRYPFVLAEAEGGDENLTVCIDETYAGLNTEIGDALFNEDGAESPLLNGAVEFLKLFHAEMKQTRLFAQKLFEYGLLEQKTIAINRDGKQQVLEGLFVIDRQKLQALDDAQALDLFRSGAMYAIHAHLQSLTHVERLAIRLDQRVQASAATVSAPAAVVDAPAPAGQRGNARKSAMAGPARSATVSGSDATKLQ